MRSALGTEIRVAALTAALLLPAAGAHAQSAACTAVNGGAWDKILFIFENNTNEFITPNVGAFAEGETFRFVSGDRGPPLNTSIKMLGSGLGSAHFVQRRLEPNPAAFRVPADGVFRAEYQVTATGLSPAEFKVDAECQAVGTGPGAPGSGGADDFSGIQSPIGAETQNTGFDTSFQQTKQITTVVNRALADRLATPGGTGNANLQASGRDDAVRTLTGASGLGVGERDLEALAFGDDGTGGLSKGLAAVLAAFGGTTVKDGNMVPTLNAAAQEGTDAINRALSSSGLANAFLFSDVTGTWLDDDRNGADRSGNEVYATFGFGYNATEQWTLGLSGSYDYADRPLAAQIGDTEVTGWAINPFVAYRWRTLVISVNGGYGEQENEVRVNQIPGLNADFDSDNYNIAGSVLGTIQRGSLRITPRGTLSYNWAEADAFRDAFGLPVAELSEEYGELSGSVRLQHDGREVGKRGMRMMPFLEPSIYYAFKRPNSYALAAGGTYRTEDLTADIEGGLDFVTPTGLKFGVAGAYRGIGQDDIDRWTLRGELGFKW